MDRYIGTTGSNYRRRTDFEYEETDTWRDMYVRPKPVIIVCKYCGAHNALGNATCVQCGAPFGKLYD